MPEHPTQAAPLRRWRFGRAEFDERSFDLSVDGRVVQIEPKPLRLLQHLLAHAGEVIHKDALVRAVWPGRIITDAALAKTIARLREALGDRDQTWIRTQHRYGYRLAIPVQVEQPDQPEPDHSHGDATSPASPTHDTTSISATGAAEYRPLTMMFCDLVGSTTLAESLDPESFRDLLMEYRRRVSRICNRYEGHVAQQMGDGLLIYFGYPAAHDDDAERALRCACDLLASFGLAEPRPGLSLRVGVHSGNLAIGRTGSVNEVLATGTGLHLAARLQALAEPGSILCSHATFRLVPGLFVTRDFGPQDICGLAEPVQVHQVLHPSGVHSRLEAATALTPFAGRRAEIGLLDACWPEVVNGSGRTVLITGEPGIGKSRLLLVARERLANRPHTWLECRATALTRHSAYRPLVELLQRGLAIVDGDPDEQKLARLQRGLQILEMNLSDTVPLLAPLLDLPLPNRYPPVSFGPALKRQRTLKALTAWLVHLSHQQPLVVVIEDLHWADTSSIDCLMLLMERLASQPILLLATARPEFAPPWPGGARFATIRLEPLPGEDVSQMLEGLTRGRRVAEPLRRFAFERSGGVPLFVEELIRTLVESGQLVDSDGQLGLAPGVRPDGIPHSLRALLMARLDRLGAARDLLHTASAIGREFSYALLERVCGLDAVRLSHQLAQLGAAGLLFARGKPPTATYVFKHALIQDAAYDTLLKSRRQQLHQSIAEALEAHFPEQVQAAPEILALHFERAGRAEPAVRYYLRAAEKCFHTTSNVHAIGHGESALRLIAGIADPQVRDRRELELRVLVGAATVAAYGRGHSGLAGIVARSKVLCLGVADVDLRARALANEGMACFGAGDYRAYALVGEQLLQLPASAPECPYPGCGHTLVSQAAYYCGDLARSHAHFEAGIGAFDDRTSKASIRLFGMDGLMSIMAMNACARWVSGMPAQALARNQETLARAESTGHPPSIAAAMSRHPLLFIISRQPQRARELAEAAATYCERYGLEEWKDLALLQLGLADCALGQFERGIGRVREAKAAKPHRPFLNPRIFFAGLEADALLRANQLESCREALDQALRDIEHSSERIWEAELHRIHGELTHLEQPDDAAAAEAHLHRALDVARSQGARSLQLRAALSLARLWIGQGRGQAAIALLRPIHAGFLEGLDTPDLVDAAALLASVSGSSSRRSAGPRPQT